jgi:hypothetical protein
LLTESKGSAESIKKKGREKGVVRRKKISDEEGDEMSSGEKK